MAPFIEHAINTAYEVANITNHAINSTVTNPAEMSTHSLPLNHGRGWHLAVATFALTPIAFALVWVRTYSRVFTLKAFGWDDALILFAMVSLNQHVEP